MATIMVKVCEECGKQSSSIDGWLTISSVDVRSASSGSEVLQIEDELDLCSQGCLLRHLSRKLALALDNSHGDRGRPQPAPDKERIKVA